MSYESVTPLDTPTAPDRKGLAIAALVCGILALCGFLIPGCSTILAIAAIVMGAMSLKSSGRVMAIIGLVLGILVLCLSIAALFVTIPFMSGGFDVDSIMRQFGY